MRRALQLRMRWLSLVALPLLGGCGMVECIDAQFEREPRPIDQAFVIVLELDGARYQLEVQCEEYYDAICAERGNYWSTRRVGTQSRYDHGAFEVVHERLGPIEIPLPSCTDMTSGRATPLAHLIISASGKNKYWLIESDGEWRTYRAWGHGSRPGDIVRVHLALTVNGQPLE